VMEFLEGVEITARGLYTPNRSPVRDIKQKGGYDVYSTY